MIRVLICDDHPVVREGLKTILAPEREIVVAGEAANAQDALSLARETPFDLVLLDISLPGMDGIDLLKELKRRYPRLVVLIVTIHTEADYAVRALRAGASGYVVKDAAPEQLVEAIRHVAAGGRYITPGVAEQLAFVVSSSPQPHEALSDREYRVMCLIASGKTLSEIAAELGLSPKTISTYRGRVLEKMGMRTNSELTHYAFQHGLVS